ncbi:hypothetical protein HLPCO_002728 [Haloplasma contractile SSD-17B]|uniref:Uncharacterized protein n=1 Tax=Haloplasma contractile SSD-17B TaxID=1033810 RepID=U2E7W3_9MOLU|nr:hypothetical protein HLPCO_002728 [Haloplasma contractile SSD-17B]
MPPVKHSNTEKGCGGTVLDTENLNRYPIPVTWEYGSGYLLFTLRLMNPFRNTDRIDLTPTPTRFTVMLLPTSFNQRLSFKFFNYYSL